jgi:predicted CopG family antitoxin
MVKVISLSDAAYAQMRLLKQEGESFSDVVIKLVGYSRKRSLMDLFGAWPGGPEELNRIEQELKEQRKNVKTHDVRF